MAATRDGWRQARLETVLDLSLALAGLRRESEVIEELVQRAVGLLDARAGIAFSLLPHLGPGTVASVGWPEQEASPAALSEAPQLHKVRQGELCRLAGQALELPFNDVLVAPCVWQDKLLGMVFVADKEARGGQAAFDNDDLTFLRSLALLAAPAIASSRELEEIQRQRQILEEENRALRVGVSEEQGLIGQSAVFRQVVELVRRIASSDVTVMVRGESGTGKERVARLLHSLSPRAQGPFVPLNCAAVPETLLEAELFGIEKGVATGVTARVGKFELASGGTLFLDEVGDLTPLLQSKLLRVVQEREIERVGGRQRLRVDVRLVTATHRDLEAMMSTGEFRQDLYYRLRVIELKLPALRDRREDIPLLAHHFLRLHGRRLGKDSLVLTKGALGLLAAHPFHGNVRELENVIEAAVALAAGTRVEAEDVRFAMGVRQAASVADGTLDEVVRAHVLRTLERCGGNRSAAAQELGIDRSTLYRMLMRHSASTGEFRNERPKGQQGSVRARHGRP